MPSIDPQSHAIANLQAVEIDRAETDAIIKESLKRAVCLEKAIEQYTEQEPEVAHLLQLKLTNPVELATYQGNILFGKAVTKCLVSLCYASEPQGQKRRYVVCIIKLKKNISRQQSPTNS